MAIETMANPAQERYLLPAPAAPGRIAKIAGIGRERLEAALSRTRLLLRDVYSDPRLKSLIRQILHP